MMIIDRGNDDNKPKQGLFAALPILHFAEPSSTRDNDLMPDQSMRSNRAAARVIQFVSLLSNCGSFCCYIMVLHFSPFATALPELCWSCICFMFRDWQEKRIPGGVTIVAAAGHCFLFVSHFDLSLRFQWASVSALILVVVSAN
mmetsp:Transcript_1727/g.3246  ORF Transcript_1727/g.3246 Transcript_1727/m.3246 type:complete len:144 (+) Transcript_1727:775-1206(+)